MATRSTQLTLLIAVVLTAVAGLAWYAHWASRVCCVRPITLDVARFENARRFADSARPPDFALVVEHGTGALAPQYHYDYEVRIAPHGAAELRYWPGYGQEDSLMSSGHFTIDSLMLDSLWRLAAPLQESPGPRPSREIPDGGASPRITITSSGVTRVVKSWQPQPWSDHADELAALVRSTIPEAVWERATRRGERESGG